MTFTLPWPVLAQANHRLVPAKNRKGLTLAPDYRRAKDAAQALCVGQSRRDPYQEPVRVSIAFHEPDRRRRDPSNLQKLIEDALSGVAYADDSLIHDMHWWRAGIDRQNPRAEITITVHKQRTEAA